MTINTVSTTSYLPNVAPQGSSLPQDLWPGILADLPRVKLDLFSRVSKQCRALMKSPQFLANLLEREDIYFSDKICKQLYLKAGPYLREITLWDNTSSSSYLKEVTDRCSNLAYLRFYQNKNSEHDLTTLNSFRKLTKLSLTLATNPVQLILIPSLRYLYIGTNYSKDKPVDINPLLSQIKLLTQLEELIVNENSKLTKEIFSAPTTLRKLTLSGKFFNYDLSQILQGNTNLISLDIDFNLTEASIDYLTKCTQLTSLCYYELPASFSAFKNLKKLEVDTTHKLQSKNYPCLASFEKLEKLKISFGDAYFPIEKLASLTDLQIMHSSFELPIESLCQLTNLIRLDLREISYKGDFGSLTALENLKSLGVPDCLTEHGLIGIGAHTAVKTLKLRSFNFSREAIKSLTSITSLYILSNNVWFNEFKYLTNLDYLYCYPLSEHPNFSDLHECTSLRKLDAYVFDIVDTQICALTGLTQLNSICIPQLHNYNIKDSRFGYCSWEI